MHEVVCYEAVVNGIKVFEGFENGEGRYYSDIRSDEPGMSIDDFNVIMAIHDILTGELRGEIMYNGLPHAKVSPEFAADFIRQSVQEDADVEIFSKIPWEIKRIESRTYEG